tara:strand:+ start:3945 stop:4607 length:663 start_codon:yes stop_codon:yes gene_type:complete
MNKRTTYFDLPFKGVLEIAPLIRQWAEILYYERRHESEKDGVDFYTDLDLVKQSDNSKGVVVTKWGKGSLESCFHCITGYGLDEILPWWKEMQQVFDKELDLKPWLPYPCILISMSNLRRHSDKGRPTAFNYPIFGEEVITNHLWYKSDTPDYKYNESYRYYQGKSILIDTTFDHGGVTNPGYSPNELRAICNMGFGEEYDTCLEKIQAAFQDGTMSKLL